jgi:alpha-glucosidase
LGAARSRDGCRSPYQWSAEPNAGFSDGTPWLPIAPAYAPRNVERQTVDTTSILALYKRLLRYRRDNSALNCGAYLPVEALNDECFAYVRECLSERRLIALNFGDKTLHLDVSDQAPTGEIVISTLLDRSEFVTLDNLTLRPHEGIIIEL